MAEQEEQQITVVDTPESGQSRTGRAVALARLLHHECSSLLHLYVSYQSARSLLFFYYARHAHLPVTCGFNASLLCSAESASYLTHVNYTDFYCIHI